MEEILIGPLKKAMVVSDFYRLKNPLKTLTLVFLHLWEILESLVELFLVLPAAYLCSFSNGRYFLFIQFVRRCRGHITCDRLSCRYRLPPAPMTVSWILLSNYRVLLKLISVAMQYSRF